MFDKFLFANSRYDLLPEIIWNTYLFGNSTEIH